MMLSRSFLFFSLILMFNPHGSAGGYDAGNGGLSLVCIDKHDRYKVNRIQFYDLWYWSDQGISPYPLSFRKDLPDYPKGVEILVAEFSKLFPEHKEVLWQEYGILKERVEYYLYKYRLGWSYEYISRTNDYGGRLVPKNFCSKAVDHPLGVYNIARYDEDNNFVLSARYFVAMTEREKNALVFHEAVYRLLSMYNLDNGEAFNTMKVTANMMSPQSDDQKIFRLQGVLNP